MPVENGGDKSGDRVWGICNVIDGHSHRASYDSRVLGRDDLAALPTHVGQMPKLRTDWQKRAKHQLQRRNVPAKDTAKVRWQMTKLRLGGGRPGGGSPPLFLACSQHYHVGPAVSRIALPTNLYLI